MSEEHLEQRLQQRLQSDPHYALIKKPFDFYKRMQERYLQAIQHTTLDWLQVDGSVLPEENVTRILTWVNMPTLEKRKEGASESNAESTA